MRLNVFHTMYDGSQEDAIACANAMDWSSVESSTQDIAHCQFVGMSDDGTVAVYYDYGADYFFFVDEFEEV